MNTVFSWEPRDISACQLPISTNQTKSTKVFHSREHVQGVIYSGEWKFITFGDSIKLMIVNTLSGSESSSVELNQKF